MTELETTENQLITPIEIYKEYQELFTPEFISNDDTEDIDVYYLENRDGNKRNSFRIILTPSGAVAVGGILRNVWEITTGRENRLEEGVKVNTKNFRENNKDSLVLEKINELLQDRSIFEIDGRVLFNRIEGSTYCLIPFSLENPDDITELEKYLKHKMELKNRH